MDSLSFAREAVPALPPLAWLFEGTPAGTGRLLHGPAVCVYDNGFVEGCLAAKRGEDPGAVANVFGSGLSTRGRKWLFLTPSHTLECLYLYRSSTGWSISNSLAFLVAHHRVTPPWNPHYGATFASLCLGIEAYEQTLWRTSEGEIIRLAYDNVELAPDGDFRLLRKPASPPFQSFDAYVGYLQESLALAIADAETPDRRAPYRPLATCSTGYDSACVAALAARLGCREAVTLRKARGGRSDSGKPVGELLGLRVEEYERPEAVEGTFAAVADFLATGMGGDDYCYRGFAPRLQGRLLLTGFHGDKIWEVHVEPNTVLARGDLSGSSLQEFRLWQDFIHIPVPMIGARRHPEIAAISHASEMRPYRLYTAYDRPIPRRVLEQADVPRSLFGQRKKAASLLLYLDARLLSPAARRECEAAVPKEWARAAKRSPTGVSWDLRYWAYRQLKRHGRRIPGCQSLQQALVSDWRVFEHSHPRAALEFLAGMLVLVRRYQTALAGPQGLGGVRAWISTASTGETPGDASGSTWRVGQ
jgi:hypothetical protein